MVYCIDIDGTLCTAEKNYEDVVEYPERVKKVNKLYESGNTVILWTGRHWSNLKMTVAQLEKWGVKYHSLFLGKPPASVYVDDKAIDDVSFFDIPLPEETK